MVVPLAYGLHVYASVASAAGCYDFLSALLRLLTSCLLAFKCIVSNTPSGIPAYPLDMQSSELSTFLRFPSRWIKQPPTSG